VNASRTIKTIVKSKLKILNIGTFRDMAIARMMNPCIREIVAPPSVLPNIIDRRLIGATSTSCKNPNCLSHNTDIPVNMDENSIAIATIPGARKYR